ncbi:MAG: DoxX family protein, partial [Muribaculaceae bacterium]|nr:DoxX family protein [Muribaculaceae bacterium]
LICSVFIMCGFLTRLMCIPPFLAMLAAEYYLLSSHVTSSYELSWQQPGYLPIMFMGIYFFIILVGPGKLSIDYFLSLHIINTENCNEDAELEQM